MTTRSTHSILSKCARFDLKEALSTRWAGETQFPCVRFGGICALWTLGTYRVMKFVTMSFSIMPSFTLTAIRSGTQYLKHRRWNRYWYNDNLITKKYFHNWSMWKNSFFFSKSILKNCIQYEFTSTLTAFLTCFFVWKKT